MWLRDDYFIDWQSTISNYVFFYHKLCFFLVKKHLSKICYHCNILTLSMIINLSNCWLYGRTVAYTFPICSSYWSL